ncbi:MAG: hypothetical protein ACRD36_11275, partial [Candidatus Acidiferrum sp.]
MIAPFFKLAALSPTRRSAFLRVLAAHLALLLAAIFVMRRMHAAAALQLLGNLVLVAGIVEGALLLGWRLAQMPKSQALEFLFVSSLRPARIILSEACVGLAQLGFVTLSGLPALALLASDGAIDLFDIWPLLTLPFTWGAITGIGLTVWAYEPPFIRRWGERLMICLIILYLLIGVLAGEHLKRWLDALPASLAGGLLQCFAVFHTHNPFGVMRWWLENDFVVGWPRTVFMEVVSLALLSILLIRAAWRLQGHFHERHYQPALLDKGKTRPL